MLQPRLFFYSAHSNAFCEILLNIGVDDKDGDNSTDNHRINDRCFRIRIIENRIRIRVPNFLLKILSDIDLKRPLIGIFDHCLRPEVTIPTGNSEKQSDRCDRRLDIGT